MFSLLISLIYLLSSFHDDSYDVINNTLIDKDTDLNIQPLISHQAKEKVSIAYIFAGSVRSFVCPKVHWSIKLNLIDALGDNNSFVFVRLSVVDNANIKTGNGNYENPHGLSEDEINETLKILNPRMVEYISLNNETLEMQKIFNTSEHRIFQTNDKRRYSMYYNRYMAYRMAQLYEVSHAMKFDWVVLARLDAMWLDPISPIDRYANDRAWLMETGFVLLNDQFMLVPRRYSDHIFSLEEKISGSIGLNKPVYCLGGPDVEVWKCNKSELSIRKYNQTVIDLTLHKCCPDPTIYTEYGLSERIHMRHLQSGKIPISLARFPVLLVRHGNVNGIEYHCTPECFRLQLSLGVYLIQNHMVYPYLLPTAVVRGGEGCNSNDMYLRPYSIRDHVTCLYIHNNAHKWKPIPAIEFHKILNNNNNKTSEKNNHTIDYSTRLEDQRTVLHHSILPNPKDLEVFRIHPTWSLDGCLTYFHRVNALVWSRCIDHDYFDGGSPSTYSNLQIFFLYLAPVFDVYYSTHMVYNMKQGGLEEVNLLYNVHKTFAHKYIDSSPGYNVTRIINYGKPLQGNIVKCLTVSEITIGTTISMQNCNFDKDNNNNLYSRQLFLTVQGVAKGTHAMSSVGMIKLLARPDLCVARAAGSMSYTEVKYRNKNILNPPDNETSNILTLTNCCDDSRFDMSRSYFEFEMLIN